MTKKRKKIERPAASGETRILLWLLRPWAVEGQGGKQGQVRKSTTRCIPFPASRLFCGSLMEESNPIRVCVDPTKEKAFGSRWPKWEVGRQRSSCSFWKQIQTLLKELRHPLPVEGMVKGWLYFAWLGNLFLASHLYSSLSPVIDPISPLFHSTLWVLELKYPIRLEPIFQGLHKSISQFIPLRWTTVRMWACLDLSQETCLLGVWSAFGRVG